MTISNAGDRRRLRRGAVLALALAALLVGPGSGRAETGKAAGSRTITLDQGWTPELRSEFYYTPQGSRLMPYAWFLALETVDGAMPFAGQANMARYGWVAPVTKDPKLNPDDLPVGFAKDPVDLPGTGPWVGMTCAACHTGDVTHGGTTIRVDGAPTLADFGTFITDLSGAVNATAVSDDKFGRFAAKVLGHTPSTDEVTALKGPFAVFAAGLAGQTWMRTPSLHAGPGRVDALTQIINALSVFDLNVPENLRDPSAPVSYPFLWLTPKLDWVQWNPVASNPIARNVGETLGVFGEANFTGDAEDLFKSTALLPQLYELEQWVATLDPPAWPESVLGPIDRKGAEHGRELFDRDCRACHNMPPFDMTAKEDNIVGKQFIKIGQTNFLEVGTDPKYTLSLILRSVKTGNLATVLFGGRALVPAAEFFMSTVGAVVAKGMNEIGLTPEQQLAYSDFRFYPPKDGQPPQPYAPASVTNLKAGPLLGIWATGPFLHNGSVPNIYELLSPPAERPRTFWVGSRELNTVWLGFKSTRNDLSAEERKGLFEYDTTRPGNGNGGHVYPAKPYSHAERLAVIEHLKAATLKPATAEGYKK